jgi:hypothetical protein
LRAKRTDHNQKQIVSDLRDAHRQVHITNFGQDFPDLLTAHAGEWALLEVKQESGSLDRGQLRFLANAKGKVAVVTTSREAMNPEYLTPDHKAKIHVWLLQNPDQETLSVKKFRAAII